MSPGDREDAARESGRPDWAEPDEWREVNRATAHLFARLGPRLDRVRSLAARVQADLEAATPTLERLTARECPSCRSVCCVDARPTFELKDIIRLHALGLSVPPHQLRRNNGESCLYLGPTGCRLERELRPFICTWWLCEPLQARLRAEPEPLRQEFRRRLVTANRDLWTMEEVFIWQVVGRRPARLK